MSALTYSPMPGMGLGQAKLDLGTSPILKLQGQKKSPILVHSDHEWTCHNPPCITVGYPTIPVVLPSYPRQGFFHGDVADSNWSTHIPHK